MATGARVEPWQVRWTDVDPQVGREQARPARHRRRDETIRRQRLVSRHRGTLDQASVVAVRFVLHRMVDLA